MYMALKAATYYAHQPKAMNDAIDYPGITSEHYRVVCLLCVAVAGPTICLLLWSTYKLQYTKTYVYIYIHVYISTFCMLFIM